MMRSLIRLVSLAILCLCSTPVRAATLSVGSKSIAGPTPTSLIYTHSIRLTGEIVLGDSEKLLKALTTLKGIGRGFAGGPLATIELDSLGGNLAEGLSIGRLLQKFEVATVVRKGDRCFSSCALAFLGGTTGHSTPGSSPSRSLEIGGQLGFHGFYVDPRGVDASLPGSVMSGLLQGLDRGRIVSSVVIAYTAEMGVGSDFVAKFLLLKQNDLVLIRTPADFLSLRIRPVGLDRPSISMSEIATNVCNHSTDWRRPAPMPGASSLTLPEARRHILRHISKSMEVRAKHGSFADQVKSIVASGDDQAVRSLYGDLGRAGSPLPTLWGTSFRVVGSKFGAGFYAMECVVSLSFGDSDGFGVVLLETMGISQAYRFAPSGSERLFLYGRDDLINR